MQHQSFLVSLFLLTFLLLHLGKWSKNQLVRKQNLFVMDQRTHVKILTVLYNFKCVRRACSGNVLTYVLILLICKQLYNRTQRHLQSTQVGLCFFFLVFLLQSITSLKWFNIIDSVHTAKEFALVVYQIKCLIKLISSYFYHLRLANEQIGPLVLWIVMIFWIDLCYLGSWLVW